MQRPINRIYITAMGTVMLLFCALVPRAFAWSSPFPYAGPYPAYPGYYTRAYPHSWGAISEPYYYGYGPPRWYVRGRFNRYGDFRVDVRIRDFSMADLYTMWWLFNTYGY